MELRQYCQAVKNINDHIADKQAERDELILTARKMHNISYEEFEEAYNSIENWPTEPANEFYVQDPRKTFHGIMHFWTIGDHGYAREIPAARVFTLEEVNSMHSIKNAEKYAWPKEYIDAKVIDNMVATKDCDFEASHKVGAAASN